MRKLILFIEIMFVLGLIFIIMGNRGVRAPSFVEFPKEQIFITQPSSQ